MLDHRCHPLGARRKRKVLCHPASKRHGKRLDSTADTQHRYLSVISQPGEQQLRQVAFAVDAMQQGRGLLTRIERIKVATTREQDAIHPLQSVDDDLLVSNRRYQQGRSPCLNHLLVIIRSNFTGCVIIVGRNADHWFFCCLRKLPVGPLLQQRLPIKTFFGFQHVYDSSTLTGISLLMLCSSEMSVSVATTPGISCNCPLSRFISCSLSRAKSFTSMV